MGSRVIHGVAGLVLLTFGAAAAKAQPASPLVDLNTVQEDFVEPLFTARDFAVLGTTLFFVHDDGIHGIELWQSDGSGAGTAMVKDVCPGACAGWPFGLTAANGALYFVAQDGVHGQELWRTDGTADGTVLVADLNPGLANGPSSLLAVAGVLYLAANDGAHGNELWKTDGTAAGTQLVADVRPGPVGSEPYLWLAVNSARLLLAADDGVHGREPWVSDGTAAGTALLKDVNPGVSDSYLGPSGSEKETYAFGNGSFLFIADDGVHGTEPWFSDGTAAGTVLVKDVNPGSDGSQPYGYKALAVNGPILFGAYDDTVSWELWSTDGTEAGTHLVKDINPAPFASSTPRELTALGGRLYFEAFAGATGRELWATDGTEAGTVLVKDVNPGPGNGFSIYTRIVLRPIGTDLLFFADDGVHGTELWASDGTSAGTRLVKDVSPGPGYGVPYGYSGITAVGSTAFFQGFTADHRFELWKSDGTEAGTAEVKNATTVKSSLPVFLGHLTSTFGRIGGRFLFDADDGISGLEPWVTDGTAASTQQLADLGPESNWGGPTQLFPDAGLLYGFNIPELWETDGTPAGTSPLLPSGTLSVASPLVALGSSWYFTGRDATTDAELWKTDGTAAGTQRVKDIRPGSNGSMLGVEGMTAFGSTLLFSANDGVHGYELWKSDGTTAGTVLLKDLSGDPYGGDPREITPLGPVAVFTTGSSDSSERDLWVTNGTTAGTVLLKQNASGLVRLGNRAFFTAIHPLGGREPWVTDGTPAGTVLLRDVWAGLGSSVSMSFNGGNTKTIVGSVFYFVADNGFAGTELFGATSTGAFNVMDIYPGPRSSDVDWMTPLRGRLFFVADDGVHGRELWVTNPSDNSTHMVKDIVPGPGSPVIQHLTAMGRVLLFSATDGVNGVEIWQSDGTEEGTVMLQNIAAGPASSSPVGFFSAFPSVYFAANDNVNGFELWSFPRSVLGSTFTDVPPGYWAFPYVEALADAGLTTGCGNNQYCPARPVTRAETAVLLVRAVHGTSFVPPNVPLSRFADVPAGYWAKDWIEQLAADGLTSGCSASPLLYCPESNTSRAQMAVLLLRAVHGTAYTPPPATGTRFTDVPAGYWAAAWIEQLAAEGITGGCAPSLFCPEDPVKRDQMAAFLSLAFRLPLP